MKFVYNKRKKASNNLFLDLFKKMVRNLFLFSKKLLEKGQEKITVMFIPHSEKRVFNFHISIFSLFFFLIIVVFVLTVGIFSIEKEEATSSELTQVKSTKKITDEKLGEVVNLIGRIEEMVKVTKEISQTINQDLSSNVDHSYNKEKVAGDEEKIPKKINPNNIEELAMLKSMMSDLTGVNEELVYLSKLINGLKNLLNNIPSIHPIGSGTSVSGFGWRIDPFTKTPSFHPGADIIEIVGTPVKATARGVVKFAQFNAGNGMFVEIMHEFGFSSKYLHLSEILVESGETVQKGQIIGKVGTTGRSTGPHLHYEVRINDVPINPAPFCKLDIFPSTKNNN